MADKEEKPQKTLDERNWDKAWEQFTLGNAPKPGPHPKPAHPYNVDPNKYINDMNAGDGGEDDY